MPYADPEKKKARKKVYYEANKEKISARRKDYIKKNPQIIIKCILAREMQIPANLIPPELIEAKVMQLKVIRFLRDAKKKTPLLTAGSI